MKIPFAVQMIMMGMLGLALLNLTHWARENVSNDTNLLQFVLGVLPNIAAGYAMPLILGGFFPKIVENKNKKEAHKMYLLTLVFTTFGLMVWEFIQFNSDTLYFDLNDIAATFIGAFLAYISYVWLVKRKTANTHDGEVDRSGVTKKD